MIDVAFNDKDKLRVRGSQMVDRATGEHRDEYRIVIWNDVAPYEGLPDSVRQTFNREQLLVLKDVIDRTLGDHVV